MIDIHSHLLPGVDDGSQSVEVSVDVLKRFSADGVDVVVCTPHLKASRSAAAPYARHREILDMLRSSATEPPRLELGWEIMLDQPGVDLTPRELSLGGSTAVLVEFPHTGVPARATDELARIRSHGSVPVLAHPERYWGCTLSHVRDWRSAGTVIQLDGEALLTGGRMTRFALQLLDEGLVDCIASDNHGDVRTLATSRAWLREIGAEHQAELLTDINPRRLLASQSLLPVPPLPPRAARIGRRALRRLRQLLSLA